MSANTWRMVQLRLDQACVLEAPVTVLDRVARAVTAVTAVGQAFVASPLTGNLEKGPKQKPTDPKRPKPATGPNLVQGSSEQVLIS